MQGKRGVVGRWMQKKKEAKGVETQDLEGHTRGAVPKKMEGGGYPKRIDKHSKAKKD